ncbi:hypothetical protein BY458DRAFT_544248 [Sporodiniella umbellata]|nr:hypothetical protein BY458DRAFT_544248 [Sporodiniella umbellata]
MVMFIATSVYRKSIATHVSNYLWYNRTFYKAILLNIPIFFVITVLLTRGSFCPGLLNRFANNTRRNKIRNLQEAYLSTPKKETCQTQPHEGQHAKTLAKKHQMKKSNKFFDHHLSFILDASYLLGGIYTVSGIHLPL